MVAKFELIIILIQNKSILLIKKKILRKKFFFFYFRPLPVKDILDRANSALGQQGYNVIYDNCEHFATDCRYGQSNSRQVKRLIEY